MADHRRLADGDVQIAGLELNNRGQKLVNQNGVSGHDTWLHDRGQVAARPGVPRATAARGTGTLDAGFPEGLGARKAGVTGKLSSPALSPVFRADQVTVKKNRKDWVTANEVQEYDLRPYPPTPGSPPPLGFPR
jgi:hypothetical protein